MAVASQLVARVSTEGVERSKAELLSVGSTSEGVGAKLKGSLEHAAIAVGIALVGIGIKSVMMAGNFQQATNQLITSAGETTQNINMVRQGILDLSSSTATSWQQLVTGMYNVESAGYHGAEGLAVLKAAAQGAKAENADLASTTDVLTTTMHNYHLSAAKSIDVMNTFIQTTSSGKMHMDDLTGALRNVLPIASQAKVSLTDVEAALAEMSLAGDKGTQAGTHLSQMLTYLLAPSSKATSVLKEVGLTTQQISDEMKVSLPGTIQMITDAVGQKFPKGSAAYIAALSAIVGGNKSMKAMLELSGQSLADFKAKADALSPTMKANAKEVENWGLIQSNFNFQLESAKNAVIGLMISIGTQLLPVVTGMLKVIAPIVTAFANWISSSNGLSGGISKLGGVITWVGNVLKSIDLTDFKEAWKEVSFEVGYAAQKFSDFANSAKPVGDELEPIAQVIAGFAKSGLSVVTSLLWQLSEAFVAIDSQGQASSGTFTTIGNSLKQLGQIFLNLSPDVRLFQALSSHAQELGKWFNTSVVPALRQAQPAFQQLGNVLVQNVLPAITTISNILNNTFQRVFSALLPVFEKAVPIFIRFAGVIASGLAPAIQFLTPYIVEAAQAVGQFAAEIAQRVAPIIEQWLDSLDQGLTAFLQIWNAVWPYLAPILKGVWDEIVGVVKIAWALLKGIVEIGLDILSGNWGQAWEDFKTMLAGVWDGIKTYLKGVWEIISGWASVIWAGIAAVIIGPINAVAGWIGGAWNTVKNATITAFNATITWIRTAWQNVIGWLGGVWHSIAGLATSAWTSVKTAIMNAVNSVVTWLKTTWQNAVNTVVGAFQWLYNHNYYFQALVDTIRRVISSVVTWLTNTWHTVTGWISHEWQYLSTLASIHWNAMVVTIQSKIRQVESFLHGIWTSITGWLSHQWEYLSTLARIHWNAMMVTIQAKVQQVQNFLHGIWNSIVSFLQGKWNQIKNDVSNAWSRISGIFSSAWGTYIAGPLNRLGGNISGFFSGLANQAFSWGKNVIQGIVDGINNMLGAVGGAASNVASKITSILGFHSPTKEGPGRDSDKWAPAFIRMFTSGLKAGIPQVEDMVARLAKPIGIHFNTSAPGVGTGAYQFPSVQGQQVIHVHVHNEPPNFYVDSYRLAKAIMPAHVELIRSHTSTNHGF